MELFFNFFLSLSLHLKLYMSPFSDSLVPAMQFSDKLRIVKTKSQHIFHAMLSILYPVIFFRNSFRLSFLRISARGNIMFTTNANSVLDRFIGKDTYEKKPTPITPITLPLKVSLLRDALNIHLNSAQPGTQ